MSKYAIEIFYSDEDKGFIAVVPELPGCSAFGNTEEAALKEVKIAIELWLELPSKRGGRYCSRVEKNCSQRFLKPLWIRSNRKRYDILLH